MDEQMNRYLLLAFPLLVILLAGCLGTSASVSEVNNTLANNTLNESVPNSCANASCNIYSFRNLSNLNYFDKVEVIHFHATNQCYSCITVGKYAEETVNTYFSEELKNGKITFAHVNIDLPENQELVKKYEVTGSSLMIGVYNKDGFRKEANANVWYKIG
ncbi:MAG: nitrophenyl compound nitroreductase subunit ArsF family protein, partial [Candidatus Micrarchaeota archaeon]|nr:nitrophenyl compound nitroreductase subunit ArsF family protein [Candidatus Micrarchaeota archaeon]